MPLDLPLSYHVQLRGTSAAAALIYTPLPKLLHKTSPAFMGQFLLDLGFNYVGTPEKTERSLYYLKRTALNEAVTLATAAHDGVHGCVSFHSWSVQHLSDSLLLLLKLDPE